MISQTELGRRIRAAREACRMTQEDVAKQIGINRLTYSGIEQGKRPVTTVELEQLAYLFGRDLMSLLADEFEEAQDPLAALFRAHPEISRQPEVLELLRNSLALARTLTSLERLMHIHRDAGTTTTYQLPEPGSSWEAIEQGLYVAREERKRLCLGTAPLGDMAEFLETQAIRTAVEDLPDEISGFTLFHKEIGVFVMINRRHSRRRRRFSHAHEYCHVLIDRNQAGIVSHEKDRANYLEVRANAFAAAFLMPEDGIRQIISHLGKGQASRAKADVFDTFDGAVHAESRAIPGSQSIRLPDVVQLAYCFQVSRPALLYRLKNLKLIDQTEFKQLLEQDEARGLVMESALGLAETPEQKEDARNAFRRRFLLLATEAYRLNRITYRKLMEIAAQCNFEKHELDVFLEDIDAEGESSEHETMLPA